MFIIEPHAGIGPVRFDMTRDEVRDVVNREGGGRARQRDSQTDCYFGTAFQVSYGDEDLADFIEVASSIDVDVWFGSRDVFDAPADELLALIREFDQPDPDLSRPPHSYIFPSLILTLWGRDTQYDHRGGRRRPVFAAVGIGAPSYLAGIRAIHSGQT